MRRLIMFMLWTMCIFGLFGCSSVTSKKQNAMEINGDGKVTASSYSSFDKEYYDPEELKEQIQSAIDEYNSSIGSKNIELKKCSKDKENIQVVISYKSGEDYMAFNGVACYDGKLANIVNSGAVDTSVFVTSSDGGFRTTVGELNAKSGTELDILVIEEPMTVKVPEDIQYTGGDVVISKGGTCVTGSQGTDDTIMDSPCYIIYGRR